MVNPVAKRQVITITPVGGMEGLQRKRGDGLDLRQFGRADIKRASEIVWDKMTQAWTVSIRGLHETFTLTAGRWYGVADTLPPGCVDPHVNGRNTLLFREYEDAVAAEVFFLDAMRLADASPVCSR